MRLAILAGLALAQSPMFATCGRSPAGGVTYDCPDGRAFTVTYADSTTAIVRVDGETYRLSRRPERSEGSATKGGPQWTDSTVTLATSGDTATVTRGDAAMRAGCVVRNPELRR